MITDVMKVVQKFLADPKTNKSSQLIVFLEIVSECPRPNGLQDDKLTTSKNVISDESSLMYVKPVH